MPREEQLADAEQPAEQGDTEDVQQDDQPPPEQAAVFPDDVVAAALDTALGVESAETHGVVRDFGVAMRERAAQEPEGPARQLLDADGLICQLRVDHGPESAAWGAAFVPEVVLGGRVFPPPVSYFNDSLRPYLARRAALSGRAALKARYLDFAWQRWRDGRSGLAAIDEYLAAAAAADTSEIEELMEADDALRRAIDLSRTFRPQFEPIRQALLEALRGRVAADRTLSVQSLVEAGASLLALHNESALEFAEQLMTIGGAATTASLGAVQLLEAADRLFRICGEPERATAARLAIAGLHEADAGHDTGLRRQHHLREALRRYRDAGDIDAVERLRPQFEQAGAESLAELQPITAETQVPTEQIQKAVDLVRLGKEPTVAGFLTLPWELGMWPTWSTVQEHRQAEDSNSLAALFGHTILTADGRFQPEPDRERFPEDFARARNARTFGRDTQMRAGFALHFYIPELRRRGHWSAPWLITALATIDEDLAARAEEAVLLFEQGRHWAALHVLVAILETAVRLLAAEAGARRSSYTAHEGFRWAALDTMLEDQAFAEATGEDFVTEFKVLFTDGHGANIRNNTAHGGAAMDAAETDATITLLAILSIGRYIAARRLRAADAVTDVSAGT